MATSGMVQVADRRATAGWQGRQRLARWLTVGAVAVITLSGCSAEVDGVAAGTGTHARGSGSLTPPSLPSSAPASTTTEPATTDPATTDPATTDPATTDPATTDPATTEPATTDPTTGEPGPAKSSGPRTSPAGGSGKSGEVTTTLGDGGAIEVGAPSAKIIIDIYEEPLCPACADFSARYGGRITEAVLSGRVLVRFRVANFLDDRSHSKNYSTRVIAALLTAVAYDRDPRTVLAVQAALFEPKIQPVENGTKDLTDAELAAIAAKAGAGTASAAAIRQGIARATASAIAEATAAAMKKNNVTGTPFVQVNGRTVDYRNTDWLTKALNG